MTKPIDRIFFPYLVGLLVFTGTLAAQSGKTTYQITDLVDNSLAVVVQHYRNSVATHPVGSGYPASIIEEGLRRGQLRTVDRKNWVSGFYPGTLWYLYEATADTSLRNAATDWTAGLEANQYLTNTHDLGFMMYSSYGNGYRLTGRPAYRDVLLRTAASLSTRFNPTVGSLKSWDWAGDRWAFPVIVDNLMNLELLTAAARLGNRDQYREQAVRHAATTRANHFRDDLTSYHVVDYDPGTGAVLSKETFQGIADNSLWARGQAWAIYGYTMLYRELGDSSYLSFAKQLLQPYLARLPEDKVPYWDFDDPAIPNAPRDASAAAVVASALLELYALDHTDEAPTYLRLAEEMLRSLSSETYLARPGTNANFALMHATGNKPAGREIDVPLSYADYYFVEALLRYRQLSTNFSGAIGPVRLEEDSDPYVIGDLPGLVGLPDGTTYTTELRQFNEQLTVRVADDRLVVTPAPDYYGTSSVELFVTTADTVRAYSFVVDVSPVNDAPASFSLTYPMDGAMLATGNTLFRWEEAQDVDGDPLTYTLRLVGPGLDTSFTDLREGRLRFPGEDLLQKGVEYKWHVAATDARLTTASDTASFEVAGTVSTTDPTGFPSRVRAYPNPVDQTVTFAFTPQQGGVLWLSIYDMMGRRYLSERYVVSSDTETLTQSLDLPTGTYRYLLRLPGEATSVSGQLVKQ